MTDTADYAEFQAWQANKAAAKAADEAARISFPGVLHRLIDAVPWNHTAERDQAHSAVDREYPTAENSAPPAPPTVVTTPANADQGIVPVGG